MASSPSLLAPRRLAASAGIVAALAVLAAVFSPGAAIGRLARAMVPAAAAQAQPTPGTLPALIAVNGEGSASAAPNVAFVNLGVQTVGQNAKDATAANSGAMAAVIAAVKAQGVADKDMQTSGFSVDPVYAQGRPGDGSPPSITGYRVSNTVSVTVNDVSAVSAVLDAAVQAGANSAVGVRFGIKDTTDLQKQALTNAVQQATAKAEAMAAAAGLKLTGAYSLTEVSVGRPVGRQVAAAAADAQAAPPVEAGQLAVTASIQATFSYSR